MVDYVQLISRAVATLNPNTREARQALYQRARQTLVDKLRSIDPTFSHTDLKAERAALESAIQQVERDAMLPAQVPDPPQPSTFADLKNGKTVLITTDDHDVFGDGTVVLKLAKGHTPGHQVLYVRLAKTGAVVLSGDLYHYPQERTLKRPVPDTEASVQQSAASRVMIEEYLQRTKTALWVEHDFVHNAKLKKGTKIGPTSAQTALAISPNATIARETTFASVTTINKSQYSKLARIDHVSGWIKWPHNVSRCSKTSSNDRASRMLAKRCA